MKFILAKITWGFILLGIDFIAKPKKSMLLVIFILVIIDLITGIIKAKINKVARTSEGYRRTVKKVTQYVFIIIIFVGGGYVLKQHPVSPEYERMVEISKLLINASDWIMLYIIYIEITSVCENLYEIDNKSMLSKYIIAPLLIIFKFGLERNSFSKSAAQIKESGEIIKHETDVVEKAIKDVSKEIDNKI